MTEYIERGALLDRIGSVPPWQGYCEPYTFEQWQGINATHNAIKEVINQQPAADFHADFQEVVRCRDCKWAREFFGKDIVCCHCCIPMMRNSFCSYGEKRTRT